MVPEALLAMTLGSPPAIASPVVHEQICVAVSPAPPRLELNLLDASDGRMWGGDAIYLLSTGDIGEASFVINIDGNGEALLTINNDIIAHVGVRIEETTGQLVTTTWWPEHVEYPPELIAELLRVDLPGIVADSIPQEFKCSEWGRKALKAGKYLWAAGIRVGAVMCCAGSGGLTPGCAVCVGAAGLVDEYVSDKLGNHCD